MTSTDTINAHIARSRELEAGFNAEPWSAQVRLGFSIAKKIYANRDEALSVAVAALKYAHEHSNDPVAFWLEEALSKIAAILSPP